MLRRPGPEHHTIPLILEPGLNGRDLEPQQMLIDDQICKVGGEELFLLLGVSLGAVDGVEGLDLSLDVKCSVHGWI